MTGYGEVAKGWFEIPGVQAGDRTLDEQLQGLGRVLTACKRKTVLDLGCAEGLIAQAFLQAGASTVCGIDNNRPFLDRANALGLDPHRARFVYGDLNKGPDADDLQCCHADIVLMLAIAHKMRDPEKFLREWSQFCWETLVIRLPRDSTGVIRHKHGHASVDSHVLLPSLGFEYGGFAGGPRDERVDFWKRRPGA